MERLIGSRGRSRTRPAAARGSRNDRTPSRVMGEEGGGRSRASPTTSVVVRRSVRLRSSPCATRNAFEPPSSVLQQSGYVVLDLRSTHLIDSWALLTLL